MNLYCQKCAEPWDFWHVQDDDGMDAEREDYGLNGEKPSVRFKKGEGCPACHWGKTAPKTPNLRSQAMKTVMNILGDDIDGAAAIMDDFDAIGMLEEDEE